MKAALVVFFGFTSFTAPSQTARIKVRDTRYIQTVYFIHTMCWTYPVEAVQFDSFFTKMILGISVGMGVAKSATYYQVVEYPCAEPVLTEVITTDSIFTWRDTTIIYPQTPCPEGANSKYAIKIDNIAFTRRRP